MKKILLTAAALATFVAAPAMAADLRAPAYKAPPLPPVPVYSWTGCYVGAGGGYGMWNQDITTNWERTSQETTAGGRGWFGTVQVGCDYQFSSNWVIGAFGDWDFGDIRGNAGLPDTNLFGHERQKWSWAAGARLGYVVIPNLLAYVSGGFTEAHFNAFALLRESDGASSGLVIPAHTYNGWFLGTGYEYGLSLLPGLFWKTEYRYSQFSGADLAFVCDAGPQEKCIVGPQSIHARKFEQTIRSELVWRFNWGGPARAAY